MSDLKSGHFKVVFLLSLFLLSTPATAEDWPTYRHDIARTGCTPESLTAPLTLHWVYTPIHPPRPAWSGPGESPREGFILRHRVIFDDAFQVAVAGNLLYFGSSTDHKVCALDVTTGQQRWSFFTGGPVRLAPTVWNGRVFVGSDDGFVYCLSAADGQLLWKIRGGPKDEKLLGNEKMISRWPIRTGVLVSDGTAYFGAGIFPHENVYLYAVRVNDGQLIWKNDTISEQNANRNDLSPQGYLLASSTQLFVPSGRALPAAFERATGKLIFIRKYGWRAEEAGGVIGGTYALLADEQIYTGTQYHLLALDQKTGKTGFAWFPGRLLTIAGNMAYMASGSEIVSMNRLEYAKASGERNSLEYKIKSLQSKVARPQGDERQKAEQELKAAKETLEKLRQENITPSINWQLPSQCDAELIVCSNLVLAGGDDEAIAINRQDGKVEWSTKVDGKARGLAAANGHLYISTDKGKIYCFDSDNTAKDKAPTAERVSHPIANPYPEDELTSIYEAAAEALITETGVTKGYGLVLGAEYGRLAYELARRTDLIIIGVEPDPEKAHSARLALDAAGLYGQRITIDQADLSSLPYSNYFANLIVSDSLIVTGKIPGDPNKIARHLKPCGGVICLGAPAAGANTVPAPSSEQLQNWMMQLELGRCRTSEVNGRWATLKRGPLPGAGKWTHQYAEPGNTACSDDLILGGPLSLLWFGEPGPAPMVNRHGAAASPLAVNGRLFIQGENIVMVYDSYNGLLKWKRNISGAIRTDLKEVECSNLAASPDSFFVVVNDKCLRLDAETGETRQTYGMPSAPGNTPRRWGYIAYVDDILYGSTLTRTGASDSVFAIDAPSGQTLWTYDGKNIGNLTIAIGGGWIFFIDSSLSPQQRQELLSGDKSHLKNLNTEEAKKIEQQLKKMDARLAVGLDAKTGGKIWVKPVDVTDCSKIGIGGGELSVIYSDGVLLLCGANANGHYWRQFLAGEFSSRRLAALSAKNGQLLWAKDANYRHRPIITGDTVIAEPWAFDLQTGQQKTRHHPLTDTETPWQFLRPGHHCGAISACPQMLLMRSGDTAYYDLRDDSGIRHFAGHRPGCWINAICADGLALIPEASAGCLCLYPIVCSLALEPSPDHQRWAIYSAGGANTPVRHLAINLGAPGDRRDNDGVLWFAYPRPELPSDRKAMGFPLEIQTEFLEGGGYFFHSSEAKPVSGADKPWVFTCGGQGLKRCTIPLLGQKDKPSKYTVRLYFAELENQQAGQRVFIIKLQGQMVLNDFDIVKEAAGPGRAIVKQFDNVQVTCDLNVELVPKNEKLSSMNQSPILCAVEVMQEESL